MTVARSGDIVLPEVYYYIKYVLTMLILRGKTTWSKLSSNLCAATYLLLKMFRIGRTMWSLKNLKIIEAFAGKRKRRSRTNVCVSILVILGLSPFSAGKKRGHAFPVFSGRLSKDEPLLLRVASRQHRCTTTALNKTRGRTSRSNSSRVVVSPRWHRVKGMLDSLNVSDSNFLNDVRENCLVISSVAILIERKRWLISRILR